MTQTTISQLVHELQQLQIKHGDVPVELKVYSTSFITPSARGSRSVVPTFDPKQQRVRISALAGDDDE